eukprot:5079867-Amphidinium_carterae.1
MAGTLVLYQPFPTHVFSTVVRLKWSFKYLLGDCSPSQAGELRQTSRTRVELRCGICRCMQKALAKSPTSIKVR